MVKAQLELMSDSQPTVTGLGAVTPFGLGVHYLWENTLAGNTCIRDGLGQVTDEMVTRINPARPLTEVPSSLHGKKTFLMATGAIDEAMKNAGWSDLTDEDGLIIGTTTGLIGSWESDLMNFSQKKIVELELLRTFHQEPLGYFAHTLASYLQFSGLTRVITSACSASTQALGLAANWVQTGKVRRCLVGGIETLSQLTVRGFSSFKLIANSPAKPFDANRCGINLSEGAAFLCIESAGKSNAKRLAAIYGSGCSSDAHHMTAPKPDGSGAAAAMKMALTEAGLTPADISWIHAHGTGSEHNDLSETTAINKLFGTDGPPVSSTKSVHGHMLGASGAVESVVCVSALMHDRLIPTRGLENRDPRINVNLLDHFVTAAGLRYILKSTLGFGGVNAAIVLGK